MAGHNSANHGPLPRIAEMRAELARRISAYIHAEGEERTAIPRVSLYRRTAPTLCTAATYQPRLIVFLQGQKHISCSCTAHLFDESTFLLTSIELPIVSQVIGATRDKPILALVLDLDMRTVREIASRENFPPFEMPSGTRGMAIGKTSGALLASCSRLLDLLETPQDIPFLGDLIQREIIYRLLSGPQGQHLRAIATLGERSNRAASAIAWLSANFDKPLHIEELAAVAQMDVPSLHHYFQLLTALSPLEYQKRLRLHMARQRMLVDGLDAASAAFEVGYESTS
jgi:AraC-like DNA-binding protein